MANLQSSGKPAGSPYEHLYFVVCAQIQEETMIEVSQKVNYGLSWHHADVMYLNQQEF